MPLLDNVRRPHAAARPAGRPASSGSLLRRISGASVKTRLLALAGLLGVLWLAVAAVSVSGLLSARSSADRAARVFATFRAERNAYEGWLTQDDQSNMYSALASLHEASEQTLLNQTWQQVTQGHATAVSSLRDVIRTAPNARVRGLAERTMRDLAGYSVFTNEVHQDVLAGNTHGAIVVMSVTNAPISNQTQSDFNTIGNLLSAQATAVRTEVGGTVSSSLWIFLILTLISLPLAGGAIVWIVRSITRPLGNVTGAAERVARGHVDIDLDVAGRDEIGQVAEAFRSSVTHLQEMARAADEIAGGNLAVEVAPKSDGDRLGHAFAEMSQKLREALGDQSCLDQLTDRMTDLDRCLDDLKTGLESMRAGDLTVAVSTDLSPITAARGGYVGALAELFNSMLANARRSLEGYNETRETLREALGDHSSLHALTGRLDSLNAHCLHDLQAGLKAMDDGDLTIAVIPVTKPIVAEVPGAEIGRLARVFNEMLNSAQNSIESYNGMRSKLGRMMSEIAASSDALAIASQEMAKTSQQTGRAIEEIVDAIGSVAQGAEQQVVAVEDVRRVTRQLAQASETSARVASETASAASDTRRLARDGVGAADVAHKAIVSLRDSSEETTSVIRSLGEKSERIGGIVATITGIAAQTNMLALNAAIEAARAGEQGRGFAVVADEVRKLAEESQKAAATISGLIEEIQAETIRAVEVVESGARQTSGGVSKVEQAREAFLRIGESVEDMNGRVERIAAAIREIAAGGEEVQSSIDSVAAVAEQSSASTQQVSASTEQTSASTQQIAAGAQQLAATADQLDHLVKQFVLA